MGNIALDTAISNSTRHCFAIKAKDTNLRLNSSSGGVFSLLAEACLQQGGVVFGAGFDESLRVVHKGIESSTSKSSPKELESEQNTESKLDSKENLESNKTTQNLLDFLRRSKYVQSDKNESFKQIKALLQQGRKVLFSGVQCEVQGLLAYLKKPYENLLTCEVICNSVPSPKIWEIYKQSLLEEAGEELIDFNFRGKDYGWEHGTFAIKTKTKTKTKVFPHHESLFMRGFLSHLITRPSCENCYAKDGRSGADITLGDFWGVRQFHKDFVDSQGISCVITHNKKALSAIESIRNLIEITPTSFEAIISGNSALLQSGVTHQKRKEAIAQILNTYDQTHNALESINTLKHYIQPQKRYVLSIITFVRKGILACIPKKLKPKLKKILGRDKFEVAIITFTSSDNNYGQILQSYALQQYLRNTYPKVSFATTDISNITSPLAYYYRLEAAFRKYGVMGFVKKLFQKIQQKCTKNPTPNTTKQIPQQLLSINRGFENFRSNFITPHTRTTNSLPYFRIPKASMYIVGSDQVWNGSGLARYLYDMRYFHTTFLSHYLLGFVDKRKSRFKNTKKIAYAPSIGSIDIPQVFKEVFKQYLSSFDALSVREECNIASLKELGLESVCVPDPTMLLSQKDYLAIATPLGYKNDVFVYMLGTDTLVDKDKALGFVEQNLKNKNGAKILYANAHVNFFFSYDMTTDFYPTPQEWIGAIADSRLVITNSFHGCVFAIIMNTPFLALKLGGEASAMNTRFETLLEIFGLQERLCSDLEEFKAKYSANIPIDWQAVNTRLGLWSQVGKDFLAKHVGRYVR